MIRMSGMYNNFVIHLRFQDNIQQFGVISNPVNWILNNWYQFFNSPAVLIINQIILPNTLQTITKMKQNISNSDSYVSDDSYISQIDKNYFKDVSFFSKQFCLPKQIKLNEQRDMNTTVQEGIQIVQRNSLDDIDPTTRNVNEACYTTLQQDGQKDHFVNADGLISMFKNRVKMPIKVRVTVCITVYSQDKQMLKKSLDGVKNNYTRFLQQAGIFSHEIVVIVIFDGIEKVNCQKDSLKNMISYFRQLDLMSGFRKKQYLFAKKKQYGVLDKEAQFYDDQKHQLENYNDDLLFTQKQLQALHDSLFQTQYVRYMEMVKLLNYIKDLSKKKIQSLTIGELPKQIKILLLENARLFMEANHINNITQDDDQLQKYLEENLAQEKLQMLKFQAIKKTQKIAKQYLQSREGTAIMYQMALPINTTDKKQEKKQQDPNLRFHQQNPKMYTFFVVKHKNSGKLSSHLWFFEGFCNIFQPDVCILIDCGLKASQDSIFKMWAHIQTYKNSCGGVCGYMGLNQENPCDALGYRTDQFDENNVDCLTNISTCFVDIQKAQMFEYHFAHIMDKPFEACFGYIHVLPGAFSGYNWKALKHQNIKTKKRDGKRIKQKQIQKKKKERILAKYLKTVIYNTPLDDIKEANMYLAEDRILCLQIYSKKNHAFNLQYLPDAQSEVDPVTSLIRMLGQRKRWINGTWFALQYVLQNRKRVNESNHSNWDKFKFRCNMFYSAFNKALSYVGISLFFIIMHFMIQQYAQNQFLAVIQTSFDLHTEKQLNQAKVFYEFFSLRSLVNSLVGIIDFLYIMSVGVCVYYSLTLNKHTNESKRIFHLISTVFGLYGVFSIALVFQNFISTLISKAQGTYQISDSFIQQTGALNIQMFIYLFGVIVISHILIILVTFDLKKYYQIIVSLPSYFFYVPSYIHLLFIYAFCRIDDLSWGTKGLDDAKGKQNNIAIKFKNDKLSFVFKWIAINVCLSLACVTLSNNKSFQSDLIWSISFYVIVILEVRLIFALIYLFKYYFIVRPEVNKVTLSQKKRLQRISVGRDIKSKLNLYIEEAKNLGLEEHIQQIKQDLKYISVIKKTINQQQELMQDQRKSRLNLNTNNNSFNLKNRISQLGLETSNGNGQQQIDEQKLKKKKKRKQNKIARQKIYVRANDKAPILQQIFSKKKKILGENESIQFSDLQKYAELEKIKPKTKKLRYVQNKIEQQVELDQSQEFIEPKPQIKNYNLDLDLEQQEEKFEPQSVSKKKSSYTYNNNIQVKKLSMIDDY